MAMRQKSASHATSGSWLRGPGVVVGQCVVVNTMVVVCGLVVYPPCGAVSDGAYGGAGRFLP
jgi:hypothetical protein